MNKTTISIPITIDSFISQLSPQAKIELVQKLNDETRRTRWNSLLQWLSRRTKTLGLSKKDITALCTAPSNR